MHFHYRDSKITITIIAISVLSLSTIYHINCCVICRVWKHVEVDFETEDAIVLKPEGEGGERSSNPIASDLVKLLCGETVCHFQVKKYYYLPEYLTNQDSQQSCHANGLYLRKFSGVDPNWFPWWLYLRAGMISLYIWGFGVVDCMHTCLFRLWLFPFSNVLSGLFLLSESPVALMYLWM